MKKKILSLIFALVLVLSMFPVTAYAAAEISTVGVQNLRSPFAGNTPDYYIDFVNSYLVAKQKTEYDTINGIVWYELEQKSPGSAVIEKPMSKNDTFELGKKYRVRIFVMPFGNRVFADNVTAQIYELNSDTEGMQMKAGTVTTPTGNGNSDYKVVSVTYDCSVAAIGNVEITGLKLPKAGENPDDDCNVLTEGVNANGKVTWTHKVGQNSYESMDYSDVFVEGETYKYSLWLRTEFDKGYWFRTDANGENVADVTVNGITLGEDNIHDTWDIDYVRNVEYEYYVPLKSIRNIDIVGISIPLAGKVPDYEAFPTTAGYDIINLFWINETLKKELIAGGMKYVDAVAQAKLVKGDGKVFEEGNEYTICIEVKPQDGYEIDYDFEEFLDFAATVNGKPADEGSGYRGDTASFDCNFGLPTIQSIFNVDVTGVDSPIAGKVPDYDAVCGADSYDIINMSWTDITEREALIARGLSYAEAAKQAKLTKGDGKVFKAGHIYSVNIEVKPRKNYEIDYDPTDYDMLYYNATVNGEDANEGSGYRGDNANFSYTFEHTCVYSPVKKAEATCTDKGKNAYYKCSCGNMSEDAEGTKRISNIDVWGIIPVNENNHTGGKATCTDKAVCTRCGKAYGSLNKNNHKSFTALKAEDPTYTKTGLTEGKKCTACGVVTIAQKTVEKLKLGKVSGLKVKTVKLAKGTGSSLTLAWTKTAGAEKYEVQQYVSKKWKTVKTTSKTSLTVKKLKANKSYKFRVRAVTDGAKAGAYSKTLTAKTVPLKTTLTLKAGKKQLTANWATVANITGYEVQYSTSKKFTKKTTKTVTIKKAKTKKATIKKLSKGKKYYVKVRAYKTVSGKNIYGAWSTVKNVKVK